MNEMNLSEKSVHEIAEYSAKTGNLDLLKAIMEYGKDIEGIKRFSLV